MASESDSSLVDLDVQLKRWFGTTDAEFFTDSYETLNLLHRSGYAALSFA